jgi:uroporphyrinogen decarboxylase
MAQTRRDLVVAQIGHQETSPIPYNLDWEGDVGERLDAYYGGPEWRRRLDSAIVHLPGADLSVDTGAGSLTTDAFGSVWRVDRRPFHLETPALLEPSLHGYRFPDPQQCFPPDWKQDVARAAASSGGHFTVIGFGFGLFERTWTLRGFEGALADVAGDPAFYQELVEAVAEHQMAVMEPLLETPADGVMFSDDWGYQRGVIIGPERWRRFIKPQLARMYARVHAAGKLALSHCCGNVAEIVPDLIEIGLDVLESVQPEAMDPYELKRRHGRDITFWGGLGSQGLLPFGTPEQIRAEVARLKREMGQGGGYILGPAKSLQPETPTANAAACVEAFVG